MVYFFFFTVISDFIKVTVWGSLNVYFWLCGTANVSEQFFSIRIVIFLVKILCTWCIMSMKEHQCFRMNNVVVCPKTLTSI